MKMFFFLNIVCVSTKCCEISPSAYIRYSLEFAYCKVRICPRYETLFRPGDVKQTLENNFGKQIIQGQHFHASVKYFGIPSSSFRIYPKTFHKCSCMWVWLTFSQKLFLKGKKILGNIFNVKNRKSPITITFRTSLTFNLFSKCLEESHFLNKKIISFFAFFFRRP